MAAPRESTVIVTTANVKMDMANPDMELIVDTGNERIRSFYNRKCIASDFIFLSIQIILR